VTTLLSITVSNSYRLGLYPFFLHGTASSWVSDINTAKKRNCKYNFSVLLSSFRNIVVMSTYHIIVLPATTGSGAGTITAETNLIYDFIAVYTGSFTH
jgi:hypothetical protein